MVHMGDQCQLAMAYQLMIFEEVTLTCKAWLAYRRTERLLQRTSESCKARLVPIVWQSMPFLAFADYGANANI
jgi:hypothetical protein